MTVFSLWFVMIDFFRLTVGSTLRTATKQLRIRAYVRTRELPAFDEQYLYSKQEHAQEHQSYYEKNYFHELYWLPSANIGIFSF